MSKKNQNQDLNSLLKLRRERLIRRNRRYARWQRNWAQIAVVLLAIYVMLPVLAPTLMAVGARTPANVIYTVYSPLCHQFAFRSFFLFGEQPFYPREAAEDDLEKSFDEAAAESEEFIDIFTEVRRDEFENPQQANLYEFSGERELSEWSSTLQIAARRFKGDDTMGYKTALCARDMAIYFMMLVGAIGFLFVRKRLRPAPLVLYALLGLGPIGLDGFSQLLSYPPFEFWPVRETIPEFRVITGALFGLMNVWMAFPYIERSMIESAREMEMTITEMESAAR